MASNNIRVFVYGSLKQGHGNHSLLQRSNAELIGRDTIRGPYIMYNLSNAFPAVARFPASEKRLKRRVYGEVYEGNQEMLNALDWLESNGRFYTRQKVRTEHLNLNVWCYFVPDVFNAQNNHEIVSSGCWKPSEDERNRWPEMTPDAN